MFGLTCAFANVGKILFNAKRFERRFVFEGNVSLNCIYSSISRFNRMHNRIRLKGKKYESFIKICVNYVNFIYGA